MRKIVAQGGSDDYRSVFSSAMHTPTPRSRARSEGGQYNSGYYYESDGYESSNSVSSSSSVGVPRGRFEDLENIRKSVVYLLRYVVKNITFENE